MTESDAAAAWQDLLSTLGSLPASFTDGDRRVTDDRQIADGYRMLATALGVALDSYLFPDPARPQFVAVNTPFRRDRRWGGDNTDAYYFVCPVDERRRYRISGNRGDSVYLSLTAYNEPAPGAWSDKVVGIVRDDDIEFADNGDFSFEFGPVSGAAALMTRDYQADPLTGVPVTWSIDVLDEPDAKPLPHSTADTAAALQASANWIRTLFAILPMPVGIRAEESAGETTLGHQTAHAANQFAAPYQVPDANFGWSARDACYSYGSFVLNEDEALVITHRPPDCRFWNLVVWNQFMATHGATDARCSVNNHGAVPNSDGTVTIVLSRGTTRHPNSLTTVDYPQGNLAFRWFLVDEVPAQPVVELVPIDQAPTTVS